MKMKAILVAGAALLAPAVAHAQSRLPAEVRVENLRPANLVSLEITDGEGKVIARLGRPLAGGKKGVVRLGRAKGCDMAIQARFDDEGEIDETVNLCREKVLRLRD
jgi:hypothetical protein